MKMRRWEEKFSQCNRKKLIGCRVWNLSRSGEDKILPYFLTERSPPIRWTCRRAVAVRAEKTERQDPHAALQFISAFTGKVLSMQMLNRSFDAGG